MLLIPSIDLRGGQCVRLLKGDFAAETCYQFGAHELLSRYQRLGARWLHVVDLDGARDGMLGNRRLIHQLATQRAVGLQVGGGLRDRAAIDDLLTRGVARVVIGSAAVEQPEQVAGWLHSFGAERICLAFDVRLDAQAVPRVHTRGWQHPTALSLWDAVAAFYDGGLRHVLCTDIDRDGALAGPNLALYREALQRFPQIQWQASGGISSGADLAALAAHGVPAAISGKALLEERISVEELLPYLPNA
ncbi:MAG TPA: 1-(5-phosphoribosyl)-5-[(5-phosphoribosylamino)methylideneamino] imidazole-4-carboxamide isomerase [Steroidobacteraceae bacterium]|nr:1-(5-phosphoribosyl)-5-[(5-phosphoribosylamino)methylideneamino] imidazole-4-carboxamide isomerase [Steroidobacteraceae bacterium]